MDQPIEPNRKRGKPGATTTALLLQPSDAVNNKRRKDILDEEDFDDETEPISIHHAKRQMIAANIEVNDTQLATQPNQNKEVKFCPTCNVQMKKKYYYYCPNKCTKTK